MKSEQEMKEELQRGLDRYRRERKARRAKALDLMEGKAQWEPSWPQWRVFDLQAEIALIKHEREVERQQADSWAREKAAKEKQKDLLSY